MLKDFVNTLDSMFNIVAVCPICHMQVHYATKEEKGQIFSKCMILEKRNVRTDLTCKNKRNFNKYYLNKNN